MAPKSVLFVASAFAGAALVAAQAAPNWMYIPSACASDCSATVEASYTCQTQFNTSTDIYGCFCNNYPSDASGCATCLNNNNAAALGSLLTSTQTACPTAIKQCFFECSFDTCASSDVACQCDATYLANIYNCASCNTANGNTGATQVSDFNSLRDSCANQNYTGATQSFTTDGLPAATTNGYMAPSLTATGGGLAATGDASASNGGLAAGGATAQTSAGAASASRAASSGASRSSTSARASGSASGATSASASAASAAASSGSAMGLAAPAFGGLLGVAGALAALL